jgi:hypothetical protein
MGCEGERNGFGVAGRASVATKGPEKRRRAGELRSQLHGLPVPVPTLGGAAFGKIHTFTSQQAGNWLGSTCASGLQLQSGAVANRVRADRVGAGLGPRDPAACFFAEPR